LGVRYSRAKVDFGTNSGRLQRPRAIPYRSKTKLRKADTNHSLNCLFRPPSAASPLFNKVGLLVVFRLAALAWELAFLAGCIKVALKDV
jgi:hypothetical protein